MIRRLVFYIFVATLVKATFSAEDGPVVETSLGSVMGRYDKSYEGRTIMAFEGIPYAKPPVGDLRFKEPQPAEPWPDTLVANRTYVCMQYTYVIPTKSALGEEDCLYLYVYVPRESITGSENLDVVIHIHGGAFIVGDPKSLAGPEYIMDRDLVYVSMNYRLGILGFLSTGDDVVPGNNGLKDQTLALQWVKDNIRYFGGNPDSVTITGSSAGGACVHHHYLSPLSKGLFHRGFSQSGTALNPWALTKDPVQNAKKLGQLFNCSMESMEAIVNCLRGFTAKEVTTAMGDFFEYGNALPSNPFTPVIEHGPGAFLPDHPYKLLVEGKFNDYPWITSNTVDEGVVPVGFFLLFKKLQELDKRWIELLPYTLQYHDTVDESDKSSIALKVKQHYLRNETLSMENALDHIKIYTDRLFLVDAVRAARLQAKVAKSPVYYYLFDHLLEMPIFYKAKLPVVAHGDDFRILFHFRDNPKVLSDNDHKMKEIFLDLLYNFATKGTPEVGGVEWNPVSSSDEEISYMHISSPDKIRMASAQELGETTFWNNLPFNENQHLFKSS